MRDNFLILNTIEIILFSGTLLLLLSVFASKVTHLLGVPSLLVFLLIGILAGSEGIGGVYFDNAFYTQTLGSIALAYILFSGGLDTNWKSISPILYAGISLSTIGVMTTTVLTGYVTRTLFSLSWPEGLLIGAIVSSTDAAAVFSVLRSKKLNLKGELRPLLELESGSNDPSAVFLTTLFIQIIQNPSMSVSKAVMLFFLQMIVGAAVGLLAGKCLIALFRHLKLEVEGLYPVLSLSLVLLVYSGTQLLKGNGFLAVYIAGIILGNEQFVQKKSILHLHDGIAWLMQIAMFLTLGLLVFPSRILPVIPAGLLLSAFLILIARPVSVFISLAPFKLSIKEKIFISWVGLRGAVPIVLATYPLLAGIDNADVIFHLVFFVVITSVMIQGTSLSFLAKVLKLQTPFVAKFKYPLEYVPTGDLSSDLHEIAIPENSPVVGKNLIEVKFPSDVLVVLIQRAGKILVPKGATQLLAEDRMLVLADEGSYQNVLNIIEANENEEGSAGQLNDRRS